MSAKTKLVRVISTGFYGGYRRRPGETFEVDAADNAAWFEDADAPSGEGKLSVGAVKGTLAAKRATEGKKSNAKEAPKYRKAQTKKASKTAKVVATRNPESVDDLV